MTTTSLKHIVSNVENIRNPVITHCYYGNLLLLSGLCFPSAFVSLCFMCFYFCSFLLQLVFVSCFCNHISFSVLAHLLILVALHFAYRPLDPYLYLLSICLANTSLVIQSMVCGCFSHPVFYLHSFLYPYFYRYHLAGMLYWIRMARRRYVGC